MTKPKNMTPEQEAEWRSLRNQKERSRRVDNDGTREKERASRQRYRSKPEVQAASIEYFRAKRQTDHGRDLGRKHRRDNYQRNILDPEKAAAEKLHSKEAGRRFRERRAISREYDDFMANMQKEAGIEDANQSI